LARIYEAFPLTCPQCGTEMRSGPEPTIEDLKAFLAAPGQGVNYAAGTWRHPLLALYRACDFLASDRSGPGSNCDEVTLDEQALIDSDQ